MDTPQLVTRKPTGQPSWPILLLAGAEKAGKTYAALAASGSEHVGTTHVITIGEDDPDEYGAIPGADFNIVEHDGTYRGILHAVMAARKDLEARASAGEEPGMIVVDSMSRLWHLLSDDAQAAANTRAKGRRNADGDYTISMDLWNIAKSRWDNVMDELRSHQGPVVLTARLAITAVVGDGGQPTGEKVEKVEGHKSLPFDVAAEVRLTAPGEAFLVGVRSLAMDGRTAREPLAGDWTVEGLWSGLGVLDGAGARSHTVNAVTHPATETPAPAPQQQAGSGGSARAPQAPTPGDFLDALKSAETVDEVNARMASLVDRLAAATGSKTRDEARDMALAATITFGDGQAMTIRDLYDRRVASLTDRGRTAPAPQPEPAQPAPAPDERRTEDVPVTDREKPHPEGEGWSRPSAEGAQRRSTVDPDDPWASDPAPSSMEQAVGTVREVLGGEVVSDERGPQHGTNPVDPSAPGGGGAALTGDAAREAMAQARAAAGLPESGRDKRG